MGKVRAEGIQAEIKQNKPFRTLEDEAVVALHRTADQLHGPFSDMLKPHGLSPTQFNALRILRGAGDAGRACSEIAERMINRDPDITWLVDRLERRGLVVRSREGRDRRVIITRITPAGLETEAGVRTISTQELRQLLDSKRSEFWNVLTDEWFRGENIPGSRRGPLNKVGSEVRAMNLPRNAEIVVYCGGPKCPQSRMAAEKLAKLGYENVRAYEGGLEESKGSGFVVERT